MLEPTHSAAADFLQDISAAATYLAAKLSATPQTTRAIVNAYAYLTSSISPLRREANGRNASSQPDPAQYTLSEGEYQAQRDTVLANETLILRHIGFATKVVLPHALALTYVQTICSAGTSIGPDAKKKLASRTIALLNSGLLSPQLLYLTHQPHMLAVAAVYLAARETGFKIGGGEWWLVWDVTREELGFLVLALRSVEAWIKEEAGTCLWSIDEVEDALRSSKGI